MNSRYNKKVPRSKAGYFLLEFLIVVALFALLVGGALFSVSFLNRLIVRAELQKLQMSCRALQWQAMTRGQQQQLTFDPKNHTYRYDQTVQQLPPQLVFGVLLGAKGPPSSPTQAIANPITFADKTITFSPEGIISSGTVYLKDKQNSAQYALTSAISNVSFMRLYRYSHNKWIII